MKALCRAFLLCCLLLVFSLNIFQPSYSGDFDKVLIIYGYPFYFTGNEFTVFRDVVTNFFGSSNLVYVDDGKLKNYLSYMSTDEFLDLNDVGLIIFFLAVLLISILLLILFVQR